MKLFEITRPNTVQLAALGQFLLGRAEDTDAERTISTDAFIEMARSIGISVTPEELRELIAMPPLNGIIQDIQGDKVIFKGGKGDIEDNTMSVDQAEKTVDQMAKRAAKK